MIWCVAAMLRRITQSPGFAGLPPELLHDLDETAGDELAREFMWFMTEPVDEP